MYYVQFAREMHQKINRSTKNKSITFIMISWQNFRIKTLWILDIYY